MIPRKPPPVAGTSSVGPTDKSSCGRRGMLPRTPPQQPAAAPIARLVMAPAAGPLLFQPTVGLDRVVLRWSKRVVNSFSVDELRERLTKLARYKPIPHAIPYQEVTVSPLYVSLSSPPSISAPHPQEWLPLPRDLSEGDARPVLKSLLMFLYALHRRGCCSATLQPQLMVWNPTEKQIMVLLHCLPPAFFVKGTVEGAQLRGCSAPEVLSGQAYGPPADIWSFGVVAVHLMSSKLLEYETEDLIDTAVVSPCINHLTPSAVTFICQCLKSDAGSRPTIVDLIMHPFFREGVGLFSDREERKFMSGVAGRQNWQSVPEEDGDEEEEDEEEIEDESEEESADDETSSSDEEEESDTSSSEGE